jgi:hypothetical protein
MRPPLAVSMKRAASGGRADLDDTLDRQLVEVGSAQPAQLRIEIGEDG